MSSIKPKILIVEHDSTNMVLIHDELVKSKINYTSEIVQTKKEYVKALFDFKPDIIFSNYTLPEFDGQEAFKIKKKMAPHTPFIFVSESIGEEIAIELVKKGVSNFELNGKLSSSATKINGAPKEAKVINLNNEHEASENKNIEELGNNEQKYYSLIESNMDAILLTVKDGQILTANTAACNIFQMTQEEICSLGRLELVDVTDPRLQTLLEERNRTGKARGELTFKRKDGTRFPGEITSVLFTDSNGLEKTSMTIKDINERKEAEEKQIKTSNDLQQALHDLNKILDSSLDIICSLNEQERFFHISAASESIWGYKPQELKGKSLIDLVFNEDVEKTKTAFANIRNGKIIKKFENRIMHKNGKLIPMQWTTKWDAGDKLIYCTVKDNTEKKNLEKAFEIERQRFLDLYSQAPSCMGILKGPNHVYELANSPYLELIGKKDIIGKTVKEVLPELKQQGLFEILDTVYQTGKTFSANEMLVKFDYDSNGKLADTYSNFIYQAHRNIDGDIDGILFFVNDVTEQVLSRHKIEESTKMYEELIQNLPVATYSCDTEGNILIYNKAAVDLWGREPETGKDLWCGAFKAYDNNNNRIVFDSYPMIVALKEGKQIVGEEIIIERPNGERRNIMPYPVAFINTSGKITGAVNVLTDITEIKKGEKALKQSEKKYRQIVETSQEGIWVIDENHKTTFVNKKMEDILEYTKDEMIGKEISFFMDEEGKKLMAKSIMRRKKEQSVQRQFKYISKSGKEVWADVASNSFIDSNGIYKGSMAMVSDITERKKNKEKLELLNKKLAMQNDENRKRASELIIANKELAFQNDEKGKRASELIIANKELAFQNEEKGKRASELTIANKELAFQNEEKGKRASELIIANKELAFQNDEKENNAAQLIRTNTELLKTNRELDRFVYSVSHDLRSPLTSILGLVSFIEEESLETDTLQHIGMIRNNVNRLDEFIKNILSYSRNKRTGIEIMHIPLQKTATDIVNSLRSIKDAEDIHFEVDIKEIQPFYSDRLRWNTLVENLVSNAIKYHKTDQKDSFIKIIGHSDYGKLFLSIIDNGIGIAAEHHDKIFDKFYRLSSKKNGSGIGLYIVKETVQILQGFINVDSIEGKGTTFNITLKNMKP